MLLGALFREENVYIICSVKDLRLSSALLEDGYVHNLSQAESQVAKLFPTLSD